MKKTTKHLRSLCAVTAIALAMTPAANAATDPAYGTNDLLFFGLERSGTTWIDKVVTFSLGSTWDVFRRAATPGDPTFGTVISLGNINTMLSSAFGADWTSLTPDTLYFGAAGQKGSTSGLSTVVEDGDYARTAYISSPRTGTGIYQQANSSARNIATSGSGGTAANIQGANSVAVGQPNPNSNNVSDTIIDAQNPLTPSAVPGTAYGSINGGIIGAASSTKYSYGSVSNIVVGLDLYRVTPSTNDASAWQNLNSIGADYGGSSGNGYGYYLGTVTLSDNGDVNFTAVPEPGTVSLLALAAAGFAAHVIRRRKLRS
jgi:hypothetical protein